MLRNLLALTLFSGSVLAWWDGGHILASAVARKTLIEDGRSDVIRRINQILSLDGLNYPNALDMDSAATWMDHIKVKTDGNETVDSVQVFNEMHYMNIPLTMDCMGTVEAPCPSLQNSLRAYLGNSTLVHINTILSDAWKLTKSSSNPHRGRPWGLALYVRFLLHLIGDAHMPFHMITMWYSGDYDCTQYCTSSSPSSTVCSATGLCKPSTVDGKTIYTATIVADDQGGNFIKTTGTNRTNLHAEWDAMGGYETRYLKDFPVAERDQKAKEIMEFYPRSAAAARGINGDWSLRDNLYFDTYQTARMGLDEDDQKDSTGKNMHIYSGVVLPTHYCPSQIDNNYCTKFTITDTYQRYVQAVSKRQIALAGYRLADVLKRLVDSLPDQLAAAVDRQTAQSSASANIAALLVFTLAFYSSLF